MIQISASHRVVGVPVQPLLQNLFPDARIAEFRGVPTILLPHGVQETVMLRNLGYEVPAPILTQYQWSGNKDPFEVQKLTAAMLTTNQRAYCLNGMGTGKTKTVFWSYDYLRGNDMAGRMLVVAPLSTLDNVWRAEGFRTCPHLSIGVLHGSDRKRRLKVLDEDHDVYVVNTDGIKVLFDELMKRNDIDTFVLDELALFRNSQSDRNKLARKLAQRMVWVWGLTGSPTPNEPTDAFGQCLIVTPHTVPKFFGRFRDEVMLKVSTFKYIPKFNATETVFRVMQPAVRYTLDDVVELPEMVERTVDIAMGPEQKRVYEALRAHAFAAVQSHDITAVNAGAVLNKLLQVSLGVVYANNRGVVKLDAGARLDALVDAIQFAERKVIVFVPYTHALDAVVERLTHEGIQTAMVHGQTPKSERDRIFNLFQNTTKFKVIAAHPGCMSHGLTLTAADTVIWYGPTTSNETFEQANARVRRIGQSHKQLMLMLQSSPAERKIYARLQSKQAVQANLLDMFAEASE